MEAAIVSELESKHQDLTSRIKKLADELTELQHRSQDLLSFRIFQPQEIRLLTDALRGAIKKHYPRSWLRRMRNKLRRPGPGALVHVIELLQPMENRIIEYKREVTKQSEDCTSNFATATSYEVTLHSFVTLIGNCKDNIDAETKDTKKKLSSLMLELEKNTEYQRSFHTLENDAHRREERWKKVCLRAIEIIKRQWHADTFGDPQVDQAFSGDLSCNEDDLFVRTSTRFSTTPGKGLTNCRRKENNVEVASACIEEMELREERVQGKHDELNAQLAAFSSLADRASELSSKNYDIHDESERMMQNSKELAAEAEHRLNSARQMLRQLSAINDQMMLLSKRRSERQEQNDRIKEKLLSIPAVIESILTGRLANSGTARMLMLDHGQDRTPSLDAGIGRL